MVPIQNFLIKWKHCQDYLMNKIYGIEFESLGPLQWTIHSEPYFKDLNPQISADYFPRDVNLRSDHFFDVLISGNKIYNSFVIIVKAVTEIVYKTSYRLPTQNETIVFKIIWYGFTRETRIQKRMNRFPLFAFVPGANQNERTGTKESWECVQSPMA